MSSITEVLTVMQKEHREWADKNFPSDEETSFRHSRWGVIEEIGELVHCELKIEQGIRGSREELENLAADAVGDIVIYLAGVADHNGVSLADVYTEKYSDRPLGDDLDSIFSGLSRIAGRTYDKYSARSHIGRILLLLDRYCQLKDWSFAVIVDNTWNGVKQRDWQKDSQSGGEFTPAQKKVLDSIPGGPE